MRDSRDHILTSHVGSLPRPDNLIAANHARETGGTSDEAGFQGLLRDTVSDVVRAQRDLGIDIPNDGEFGKAMGQRVNYRAWSMYAYSRLSGLDPEGAGPALDTTYSEKFGLALKGLNLRRDRVRFNEFYTDPDSGIYMGPGASTLVRPRCIGPLAYTGYDAVNADIANLKAALSAIGIEEGFMTSVSPASCARIVNDYYKSDEEFLFACADAMREEYKAIVESGLILQIDDPSLAESWDSIDPEPPLDLYKRFIMVRVDALNHAIRGLPEDRIRLHLCWGSWHGPHVTDLPLRNIVDVMFAVKCQGYSFEAANARHEHEWTVWRDVKLPDGKLILPGIVSHATNVVEHPELVAQRIVRFAELVGRERVIASSDCGFGGRIHPQIAWAKVEALAQGAALASKELWR